MLSLFPLSIELSDCCCCFTIVLDSEVLITRIINQEIYFLWIWIHSFILHFPVCYILYLWYRCITYRSQKNPWIEHLRLPQPWLLKCLVVDYPIMAASDAKKLRVCVSVLFHDQLWNHTECLSAVGCDNYCNCEWCGRSRQPVPILVLHTNELDCRLGDDFIRTIAKLYFKV